MFNHPPLVLEIPTLRPVNWNRRKIFSIFLSFRISLEGTHPQTINPATPRVAPFQRNLWQLRSKLIPNSKHNSFRRNENTCFAGSKLRFCSPNQARGAIFLGTQLGAKVVSLHHHHHQQPLRCGLRQLMVVQIYDVRKEIFLRPLIDGLWSPGMFRLWLETGTVKFGWIGLSILWTEIWSKCSSWIVVERLNQW